MMLYTTRLLVVNGHQNYMCYNEIGLCAHNIDTILETHMEHTWEHMCDH